MGSLEEENLFQMVHDFIEPESASPVSSSSSSVFQSIPFAGHHSGHFYLLQELLESGTAAEVDVLTRVLKHMKKKMDSGKNSSLKKWLIMRLRKDGFDASLCQTSWPTTFNCPGGEYEYIEVSNQELNHNDSKSLIIDIDFKSQFELARPTSSYKQLTEKLPAIFVGDANKLNKIISILCSEAKHSLRESGLHIPPWRTSIYMQSKWFAKFHNLVPSAAKKIQVGSNREASRDHDDDDDIILSKWAATSSNVKAKGKDFVGKSGLSREFSTMSTTRCF